MMRRLLRPGIWAAPIGLLWAATASASSITTYGSIVLSTLGTDGMSTNVADASATVPAGTPAVTDTSATIGGNAPVNNLAPIMGGSTKSSPPGGGGGGGGSSPAPAPAPATTTPATAGTGVSDAVPVVDNSEPVPIADVVKPEVEVTINPDGTITETPTPKEEVPMPPIDTAVPGDPVVAPTTDGEIVTAIPIQDVTPIDDQTPTETPEPATLTLLGLAGVGGLWHSRRRRK